MFNDIHLGDPGVGDILLEILLSIQGSAIFYYIVEIVILCVIALIGGLKRL